MIDIHCHVVYGVDDGAQSFEEMQAMLRLAAEQGVRRMICTSHITPGEHAFPAQRYLEHLKKGQDWCQQEGLPLTLHSGSEILWTEQTPRLLHEGFVPTLDNTWTVLVEFWYDVPYDTLCRAARLLGNEGMTVIFAHIERYRELRHLRHVEELKHNYGVLMQMNCRTVIEKQGLLTDRWRDRVLSEGLIDMVASDAHNTSSRACNLAPCHAQLTARYGSDYADALCGGNQARLLGLGE